MIKSLNLKYFRQHENLNLDFTRGLNLLRGPNESGKTTVTEGILYALYGPSALVDSLEQTVTWGRKESELKVEMTIRISGTDYYYSRSESGAEIVYQKEYKSRDSYGGWKQYTITGKKECNAFSAQLLGADAKTANVLMLVSQSGLRGALDDGATGVSALMGKLSNFDLIDVLLGKAATQLSLGSAAPLNEKLVNAEVEAEEAHSQLVSEDKIQEIVLDINRCIDNKTLLQTLYDESELKLDVATGQLEEAKSHNLSVETEYRKTLKMGEVVREIQKLLEDATAKAQLNPPDYKIKAAQNQVETEKNYIEAIKAYEIFNSQLKPYPKIFWDDSFENFEIALKKAKSECDRVKTEIDYCKFNYEHLSKQIITGNGKCPVCGSTTMTPEHISDINNKINEELEGLAKEKIECEQAFRQFSEDFASLSQIMNLETQREKWIYQISDFIEIDKSVIPSRVSWKGNIPASKSLFSEATAYLETLEAKRADALKAEGMVKVYDERYREAINTHDTQKIYCEKLSKLDIELLSSAYESAYSVYRLCSEKVKEINVLISVHENNLNYTKFLKSTNEQKLARAQARIDELKQDIKTLEFNNELIKRLKSMKPLVTDHLWNKVLGAVSNYFSILRGEKSIVTKGVNSFVVNGRTGSLSGSTLDILAVAIRVALTKTFVPHCDFMILDEPAHGADQTRTSNLLGFLQGCGFNQVILASHDELSESVADKVIQLGV